MYKMCGCGAWTWFRGELGSVRLMAWLDDLKDLLQPQYSIINCPSTVTIPLDWDGKSVCGSMWRRLGIPLGTGCEAGNFSPQLCETRYQITSVMQSHLFTNFLLILRASFCITGDCPGKRKRNHQKVCTIDVVTPLASFATQGEEEKESSKSNSLRI